MATKLHRKKPAWLFTFIFAYLAILAALTILNRLGADRLWFGALNLYLPQVVWALPGILLAALTFKVARRWTWLPLLGIAWVLGPLMGFCWPLNTPSASSGNVPLRIMTWNVKYERHDNLSHLALRYEIERCNPTVVLLQEAQGLLNGPLGDYFSTWNVRSSGQYIIASRMPLGELRVIPIPFPGEGSTCPGIKHTCLRTQLRIGGTVVVLYNVHFETPRWGLNAFRAVTRNPLNLPKAMQQLEHNVAARLAQVQTLRENVRQEQRPVIVAGDLNSPDSSLVCKTLRALDFHDAFAEGGKGYGYTYGHDLLKHRVPTLNLSWMRIDHIMMSSRLQSRDCWTGTGKASDHRPVIADLVLVQTQ
ncbi:MAG TPA: endonuclease/exonuclease/phosphatase family protein [Geobacteraceae bacterium]|nr:endonuclease/exonuclease/phosphatase family protein [Geobacteraceae bacterium]